MVNPEKILVRNYTAQFLDELDYPRFQTNQTTNNGVTWIEVDNFDDLVALEPLLKEHSIHPIIFSNLRLSGQRSKLEVHSGYAYIVTKLMSMNSDIELQTLALIWFDQTLITVSEKTHSALDELKERLRNPDDPLRQKGCDFLVYSILDDIVDDYNQVLDVLTEKVDIDEVEMLHNPSKELMSAIQTYKKSLFLVYRTVWPLREVLNRIVHGEIAWMDSTIALYHRDVLDHLYQILDVIDLYREIVSSMMEVYLSSLSIRMNEIMKVLTIISTIFIPLTFIVGVYGMNFHFMPEYNYPYAYPLVWLIMAGISLAMLIYFKRKKWF